MAKAKQHFVPRVYLRRWSPIKTDSVYYFDKHNLTTANKRNVGSILYNRHTYTVCFDDLFVLNYMPLIKQDFIKQTMDILKNHNAIACLSNGDIITEQILSSNIKLYTEIDEWSFRRKDNIEKYVSRKSILSQIKDLRSYILEVALDDFVEKKWNSVVDSFLFEVERESEIHKGNEDIYISQKTRDELIHILLLFMCRNPNFDYRGILTQFTSKLYEQLLSVTNESIFKEHIISVNEIQQFITRYNRGIKLIEVYKGLFHNIDNCENNTTCKVVVLKCNTKTGSFVTSDNPAFSSITNMSNCTYNVIYFPLTPQFMILVYPKYEETSGTTLIKTIKSEELKLYNSIIYNNAIEGIVSNTECINI